MDTPFHESTPDLGMVGCRNRYDCRIHPVQPVDRLNGKAPSALGHGLPRDRIHIDDRDKVHALHRGEATGMVLAHLADPYDRYSKITVGQTPTHCWPPVS
jgi:hypothetical protein